METISAIRPADLADLPWDGSNPGRGVPLPFTPCTAVAYHWGPGTSIAPGERARNAFHVVLAGSLRADGVTLSPGSIIRPAGPEVPWTVEEGVYVLSLRGGETLGDTNANGGTLEAPVVQLNAVPWIEFFCVERGYSCELHPDPVLEVKLIRYRTSATIPRHFHTGPTLSTVVKGSVDTPHGVLGVGSIFWCRGTYGPWNVLDDLIVLVAQARGTAFVPTDSDSNGVRVSHVSHGVQIHSAAETPESSYP